MTALTAAVPAARTPSRPHGMVRSVLRLHRTALVMWSLALAAGTTLLTWLHFLGDEARRGVSACAEPATDRLPSCTAVDAFTADTTYADGIALVTGALAYLIFPVAAWAGAALTGRELETGTARFAWTQAVSPTRWLAARLALPAALLTTGAGGIVLLNVWARGDGDPNLVGDWYQPDVFLGTGPACVAHALAGLAIGALIGLLTGRTLSGAGLSFAACLVLYNLVEFFREDLWFTVTRTSTGPFELPRSAYQTGSDTTTGHGVRSTSVTFHPEAHFWPLQLMESGIVLAVAALAALAAFRLLRRRTA